MAIKAKRTYSNWSDSETNYLRDFINNNYKNIFKEIYQYIEKVKNKTMGISSGYVGNTAQDYAFIPSAGALGASTHSQVVKYDDSKYPYFTSNSSRKLSTSPVDYGEYYMLRTKSTSSYDNYKYFFGCNNDGTTNYNGEPSQSICSPLIVCIG